MIVVSPINPQVPCPESAAKAYEKGAVRVIAKRPAPKLIDLISDSEAEETKPEPAVPGTRRWGKKWRADESWKKWEWKDGGSGDTTGRQTQQRESREWTRARACFW